MSKIAFLFPGQGAQTVGMGKSLYDTLPAAKEYFDQANQILGYDLASVCFEGPSEKLDSTVHSQPALFVTSIAALAQLRDQSPDVLLSAEATAGLSLGEYTAMVFAGVMEFEDALKVVQVRGEAMQAASDATPSGMVSILGLEQDAVEKICDEARGDGILQIANLLCPGNIVVSGTNDACERAAEVAEKSGAMKVIPLAVAGAFHTEIMRPAVDKLTAALANVTLRSPKIPVISNVDAQPHDDPEEIRSLLQQQVCSQVRWEQSMRYLLDQGFDEFYEIGAGKVLRGLMKRINRKVAFTGVEA
ncbi:[acyl-carrier-protein] S-malonyltransferase [Blastopirellula marina]|uniref:Malonyl CoA-acyl carrier protein transacylase n=1 Tax=Blastopirellula marina TaxID=124 RepID=A0A2S8FAP7_9BACT|nr:MULTISPECIES: ACP S-malonyltransferase [Pirellulaceae]PQO29243.1 [acyl-carrier-protein] S-malonyltransferase [Blastopirellula marina]RCS50436.1 [acyl-carrier-protein] S-malonyltransferase [Bremerella cremea]